MEKTLFQKDCNNFYAVNPTPQALPYRSFHVSKREREKTLV
jgi:hypothetical protein